MVQDWSACILTQTSSEEITFPTVFSFRVENNFYENTKNISYTYCQWSSASLFIVQVFLRPIHEDCVKLKEILTCVLFQMLVFSAHFSGLLPVVLWLFLDPHPDTQGSFPECYPFHLLCWNHLLELLFLWLDCPRPISWEGWQCFCNKKKSLLDLYKSKTLKINSNQAMLVLVVNYKGLIKITFLLFGSLFSFGPWTRCQSVCSRWSMEMTCFPPLRTCRRRAAWCGFSAESICIPLSPSSSTWSSVFSSQSSQTPMTPSR